MYFVDYIFFSEMTFQKWIVVFAFLALFTSKVEARICLACLVELISQLNQTIASLENCSCDGKSPNFPVINETAETRRTKLSRRFEWKGSPCFRYYSSYTYSVGQIPGTFTPTFTKNPEQNHLPVSNLA